MAQATGIRRITPFLARIPTGFREARPGLLGVPGEEFVQAQVIDRLPIGEETRSRTVSPVKISIPQNSDRILTCQ